MEGRDDKTGQFTKGNTLGISTEVAREYQLRSAAKRKENRLLADTVRRALEKKASSGSDMTRLEYLAEKAINNHATGEMTFKDLRDLQKILGEDVKTIDFGDGIKIVVESQEDADMVADLLNHDEE